MMKRGLFLTHINQIRFRLDVGQQKMTNEKSYNSLAPIP